MQPLFRKSLALMLVAVLTALIVSCAPSTGEGTSASAGEGTSASAGEGTSASAAEEGLTAAEEEPQAGTGKTGEETRVVILATSDLHGNVWGYTYEDNAESSNDGMARLYTYIKQVREENPCRREAHLGILQLHSRYDRELFPRSFSGGTDRGQQLAHHRCRPVGG